MKSSRVQLRRAQSPPRGSAQAKERPHRMSTEASCSHGSVEGVIAATDVGWPPDQPRQVTWFIRSVTDWECSPVVGHLTSACKALPSQNCKPKYDKIFLVSRKETICWGQCSGSSSMQQVFIEHLPYV